MESIFEGILKKLPDLIAEELAVEEESQPNYSERKLQSKGGHRCGWKIWCHENLAELAVSNGLSINISNFFIN